MTNPTPPDVPLIGYRDRVKPEWIDSNDHMNSMHYKTITDGGMRALLAVGGLNREYVDAQHKSAFQLEMHICYEREMRLDDPFEVRSWLVGADTKRLHHFHEIVQTAAGFRAATVELMTVHIDRATRRTAPMPEVMQAAFRRLAAAHAQVPHPANVSRRIGMQRPTKTS